MTAASSPCSLAEGVYHSHAFTVIQWLLLATCASSLIVVAYSSIRFIRRRYFGRITTELIAILYVYLVLYASAQLFTQGVLLVTRYTAATPCDSQFPRVLCIPRLIGHSVVPSFVIIHLAITTQRAFSTFSVKRKTQCVVSRIYMTASLVYAVVYGTFAFLPEPLEGRVAYCSSITQLNGLRVIMNIYAMFALVLTNLIVSLVLWKYNKNLLATWSTYSLDNRLSRSQNVHVLFKFLLIEIVQAGVYTYLFVAYALGFMERIERTLQDQLLYNIVANLFPYYTLACPFILTVLGRTRKNRVIPMSSASTSEIHFKSLHSTWGVQIQKPLPSTERRESSII